MEGEYGSTNEVRDCGVRSAYLGFERDWVRIAFQRMLIYRSEQYLCQRHGATAQNACCDCCVFFWSGIDVAHINCYRVTCDERTRRKQTILLVFVPPSTK